MNCLRKLFLLVFVTLASTVSNADPRLIAVDGEGIVRVPADQIHIEYFVTNVHPTDVSEAKAKVDRVVSDSLKALINLGINQQEIKSHELSIYDRTKYDEHRNDVVVGHEVSRHVSVRLDDISLYRRAVQSLVDAGVSNIDEVYVSASNERELKRRALAEASANAKSDAEFLADQFGARISRVNQIGRIHSDINGRLEEVVVTAARLKSDKTAPSDYFAFQPGMVEVEADIYVIFELESN